MERFRGGGIAGDVLRATNWTANPLGDSSQWPQSLTTIVRAMLSTRQAMCLFWGPALINLYNDGFIPLLGEKHPAAMGQEARVCWSDAWPVVGGLLNGVVTEGNAVLFSEMLIPIVRDGKLEDAWWNYSYSPVFDDAGDVNGVLVVATETTAEVSTRRELEAAKADAELARQEMQAVFLQAPVPMALLKGPEHRFVLVNAPYISLVNRDVRGKTLAEAFNEVELGFYRSHLDRVFETGESVILKDAPLRLPNEQGVLTERFIDVGYHAYRQPDGSVTGVFAIIHDVTSTVFASRAKDEFLAVVSHELRTPLNAILGWSRLLLDASAPRDHQKGLVVIERNASAQAKLIEDILDVSRIISGKVVIEPKRTLLADVVQNAVESIKPAAAAKRVQVELSLDDADIALIADESRLQQVVWNLLSNAVKFTPAGGHVRLSAIRDDSRIIIRIEDSGRGISAAFLPHVFERFRQDDASTTRKYSGLGLGLAIVRHIVELHGGTVTVSSEGEGRGATFEVLLPIRAIEPESVFEPEDVPRSREDVNAKPENQTIATGELAGIHVLVVDDEDDARELIATVLETAGATVTEASSVAAAHAVLADKAIDVIVSDIGMPSEDGYSFMKRLRSSGPDGRRAIPSLALSAYARDEDRRRALDAGFHQHITKPVKPLDLVRAVTDLLKAKQT